MWLTEIGPGKIQDQFLLFVFEPSSNRGFLFDFKFVFLTLN
jgi:hypothetical protein